MSLQWSDQLPATVACAADNFNYFCGYVTTEPENLGKYLARASKPNVDFPGTSTFYTIGYFDTPQQAQAACQTDYDTYGPNLPPGKR